MRFIGPMNQPPSPPPPGGINHGDLRRALLEAAAKAPDIEHISLRELASGLGVSAAAVYRHFDSREALLAELPPSGSHNSSSALPMRSTFTLRPLTHRRRSRACTAWLCLPSLCRRTTCYVAPDLWCVRRADPCQRFANGPRRPVIHICRGLTGL